MIEETQLKALLAVRSRFKSDSDMATAFGVTQPTVWRWINVSGRIPPQHALKAEALAGVSRHLLRPDIYPVEVVTAPPAWHGVDRGDGRVSFQNGGILQCNQTLGAAA